ncbi:hypothetical protein M9Y10_023891 [Tritrichomonas musculus]|uniref:Protein kinase domain-containing protein n=1 Tax=Tritrichomonas musculus TaxID=1915356 RepID=A0ABR2KY94_9EUKA
MISNQLKIYLSTPHEFSHVAEICNGRFNRITQVIHNDIQNTYIKRSFTNNLDDETYELFIQICEELLEYQKKLPFSLPISFIIELSENIFPALITPYYEKRSLRDLILYECNDDNIHEFDEYQRIIFIYCLALFLEQLHSNDKFHGNFKASNIIIDDNFYPLVSDLFLYKLHTNDKKEKTIDSVVSLPPEILLNLEYSTKSDIYSFGIIVLQIFHRRINIFSNKNQDVSEIEKEINNFHFEDIIDILPESIRSITLKCLSYVPEDRPNASEIRSTFQEIISKAQFNDYYTKLQNFIHSKFESEDDENELKKEIENNNIEYLFKYAVKIKQTNENEALLYFRYGANQNPPHTPSLKYYESICRKRKEPADQIQIIDNGPSKKFIHLMNDPFFMKTKIDMNTIVNDVNKHFNDEETIEFDKEILKKKGFILTKGAQKRLTKICRYILEGVPVLLEGDTGTAKTKSVQICCEMLEKRLVKYNLSSETKTGDLLGRYVGDPNSWSGIKMHEGPFIDAFEGRKDDDDNELSCVLLLDEINLANQECLHFIEETLDSDEISTEIPGMPLKKILKGPGFRLIATQNPNKGLFQHKRQNLGLKFYSRFQVIHFPKLEADELKDIALGLADCDDFNYKEDAKLINDLVDFHVKWSELPEIRDEVQCFTVREIEATIHALRGPDALNPYDAVMTIYGARYQKEKKFLLTETLLSFESFKKYQLKSIENKINFKYVFNGVEFPDCYHNKNLADALQSVFISFKMNRHVILAGEEGCGLTKIARLISQCHNMKLNDEKSNKEYFCICTEETKCSDLIGGQRASESIKKTKSLIKWKQGFLSKAIKSGHCAILDSIDEATSTVTERINPLLDQKFDSDQMKFEVPENPNEPEIMINPNFRLLCTCKVDKINQMSPAFINRFDVVVLENQLENIEEKELKELISMLMKEATISPSLLPNKESKSKKEKDNEDDWFDYGSSYYSSESDEEKNNEEEQEAEEEISKDFTISDEIIDLVYQRLDIKKLPTFQNLSQFCKAVAKYSSFFDSEETITMKDIVDFSYKMLQKTTDFAEDEIPISMINFLLDNLKNKDNEINGQFIYKESKVLRTFIAKLYAASIINLPVCVYGPTGVGKTSAAEQFSKERSIKGYQKHSFHAGTKPKHFYATTTIQDKKISLKYGSLTTAMIKGQVFIADEMNLSSLTNMKSLAPALEPCIGKDVFIPGIGETISIDPDFFFIACQNELGTLGRNAIPTSIASRFRYFDYPELKDDEIAELCVSKRFVLYDKKDREDLYNKENFIKDSRNLGRFMITLNNLKQRVIPKWSFRDITKIFLRICQQDAFPNKYKNITFYHHVLFYTMSVANEEDSKVILEKICDLIHEKFELSTDQRNEIFDCYICDPEIDGRFLMKGKSGVLSTECDISSPAPLLNALFITKLSHESEPIIYMGSSGYKTYLAKKLLRNAKTITLNQESTNAQLLGKSYPFTKTESKLFYLDTLTKILNVNYDVIYNLKEKLQNNNLKLNEFITVVSSIPEEKQNKLFDRLNNGKIPLETFLEKVFDLYLNRRLPESFKYAFINLTTKLFTESDSDSNSIISNFVFEFKPGLFLSSILEGKSLILKNLSNLPTIVFERFNEVFSGEHSLTLQEDINNTFTEENTNRKLSDFNDTFRVFGTCPPNSITKLSEAVLSRFTVIYTHEYQPKDQKKVLYFLENLKLDQSLIDYIINFSEQMNNDHSIKRPISFIQMINIIDMCSRLISMHENIDQKDILRTVLYRVVLGLFEKRDRMKGKLREKINNIFNDIGIPLLHELTSPLSENPIYVSIEKGIQIVKSKITNISIQSPTAHEVENDNISFTKMFVEMVETIHLGLASNTPVILEGLPGQGKQTAIKLVADTLGYNVINIMISQSTKADDLLGKLNISYDEDHNIRVEIIKTKLVEAIESENKASSSIIVFHNINHASSAVLEVIQTIFDSHESNICLTNGTLIPKGKLNLIGIYNTQNGYSNRANLPSSLIYSSLYYIVNNPTKDELRSVIQKLFRNTEFQEDWEGLYSIFNITNKIAKDNNTASILTLNDVVKYIIFRKATFAKFDKDIITQMIFAYRFINEETIKEVKKQINVNEMNFSPSFNYNIEKLLLNINVKSDDSKEFQEGINIELFTNKINVEDIESNISCLTLPQKHCLLFLACSVISKRSCILQGATSSGKSHIIRLFAKMLGQELIVYQMNKDTGISILTGQPLLSSTLNNEDIDNIILWFENISIVPAFKEYIKDNFSENPKEWKLTDFSYLLNYIDENQEMISENNKEFINKTVIEIKKIIRHEKRFTHQESEFIKALKEGKWVLIDGIESAPPEIAQKISSLCGDDPELHLIERGKNNYFSRNKRENAQPISDNFHLFVTFNPSSQKENISLDPTFFNKCVSFTLPPIDSTPEYSAQILHGSLVKMLYPNEIAIEIGARMSMSHKVAKNESMNNNDVFAGDLQFTGRTLKFITTEFQLHSTSNDDISNDIYMPVCNSFHSFYWNSEMKNDEKLGKNEGKLKKYMIDAFSKPADNDIVTSLNQKSDNPKVRNVDVLMILRSIQLFACKKVNKSEFSYEFIQKCRKTRLSDIPFVIKHIEDTISIINDHSLNSDEVNQFECHQLIIILNILYEINNLIPNVGNEFKDVPLDNSDLLSIDNKLEFQLLKLQLLEKLQNDNFAFINPKTPEIFYNQKLLNLFQIVIEMTENPTIDHFDEFISIISKNQQLIPLIESIFPYNLFMDTQFETMNYWMPMFLNLYNKKITFHVKTNENEYDFINDESKFEPTYVFDQNNAHETLLLYPGTRLKIHSLANKDSKSRHSHEKHRKTLSTKPDIKYEDLLKKNYEIYGLTQFILSNNITDDSKLEDEKKKYSKKVPFPKENQKSKFSLLLPKNAPKRSMVSNIWSLIFSMQEDCSNILSKYLHPLEIDIYKYLSQLLQVLNRRNINGILALTKWMNDFNNISFGDENRYLWKLYDGTLQLDIKMNENKIQDQIDMVRNEIDYLSSSPKIKGWSTDSYIDLLKDKVLFVLQEKLQEIISSNQERKIKSHLIQLIKKVRNIKTNKEGHKNFKDSFINAIQNIIDNNPTEELLLKCQENYDDFIKVISKDNANYTKENFNWPSSSNQQESQFTSTIKLYQHILWYSQASTVIERITNQNEKSVVKNISDLCEIPDLKGISSYLISKICRNDNLKERKIDNQDLNLLKSTLNAHFICKLLKDDLFDRINDLDVILNNLENRKSENSELIWIDSYANKYPLDLQIVLPHFLPNDIFSLFVCYENNKTPSCGPYFKDNKIIDKDLVNSLKAFLRKKTTNDKTKFTKYCVSVGIEIYRYKINNQDEIPNDFNDFRSFIQKELDSLKSDKNKEYILKHILEILKIGEQLTYGPRFSFTFNDILFLEKDWINDETFVNKYPSLVYWLSLHEDCKEKFQHIFRNYEFSDQKLPFWLFALRIMSSLKCIKFNCNNQSRIANLIKDKINKSTLSFFEKSRETSFGTKWINFLLPKVPSEIFNSNYKMLYQFFVNLSQDNTTDHKFLIEQKEKAIELFAQKITEMVFEDSIDSLMNMTFNQKEDNDLLAFIIDPQSQIDLEINKHLNKLFSSFMNNNNFTQLKACSNSINDEFDGFINILKHLAQKENSLIDSEFEQTREKEFNSIKKKYSISLMNIIYCIMILWQITLEKMIALKKLFDYTISHKMNI